MDKHYLEYLETHVVDHCNLKCRACCHYSNVSPEGFLLPEIFEEDLEELSKKFNIGKLRLMGGEPLLHPGISKFMRAARKHFLDTDIRIVTNAILLERQPDDFWETLIATAIKLDLTKYPIGGVTFSEALDEIGRRGITYEYNRKEGFHVAKAPIGRVGLATNFQLTLDSRGNCDILEAFYNCPYKRCINLIRGKIMHCPPAGYANFYNTYFGKNLPAEEGIDIYDNSAEEILNYLSKPIEFCKYCQSKSLLRVPYSVSRKEEDEWFVDKQNS